MNLISRSTLQKARHASHVGATAALAAMLVAGTAYAVVNAQAQTETVNEAESSQPVGDTWITTKVKSKLLAHSETEGTEIDVDTLNGVVHLSGALGSQAEIDKAVEIARSTEGVVDVDASGLTVSIADTEHPGE
ncbi:BON domain-containing protein [Marilutibacter alkalisoli]|nr:BON domain-containing protein [Lysobacter alkalisoli]